MEVGLSTGSKSLRSPGISGDPRMNCLLILAFSSRGQGSAFPLELLDCTLADLHGAHQGINRMQAQVREAVYWPGIDADITDHVHWCPICTKHKASPPAWPIPPSDIPDGPWQEITANYLTHKVGDYLLVCALFSKYPLLYKVSTKSAQSLGMHLQELISQYGLPCLLYTDNGPPFVSEKLAQFLQHNHIDHVTSSSPLSLV